MPTFQGLSSPKGYIKAVNLNNSLEAFTLNITNAPSRQDFMINPHGLSTWRDPHTGKTFM